MKRHCMIFLLAGLCLSLPAQPESQKGYIGASVGMAIPVDNFASAAIDNDQAGYARPGFNALISTHLHVRESIGFVGMLGYNHNPYNENLFIGNYLSQYPGQQYQFSSGDYELMNLLSGVFFSIPQGILDINLRGYIGISVALLPATNSSSDSGISGDPHFVLETEKNRSTAFTYGGGVNLMFYTNTNLAIIVDANYIYTEPEFNAVEIRVYEDGDLTMLSGIDLKQKFQVISLGAGLAFIF